MKVLIPVDGSDPSLYTIQGAARFLDKSSSRVYLFTVRVPVAAEMPWALMNDEESVQKILEQARQEADKAGLTVERAEHTTFHEPASAICEYAEKIEADLILIGSHGYQGIAKFLVGSVSERVFKQAKRPVIIIRNDQDHAVKINRVEKQGSWSI
jgi:nucleotide-binding universal stress UspA family protein